MQAKIQKLQEQFTEGKEEKEKSSVISNIFQGVAIHVNGYTSMSIQDIVQNLSLSWFYFLIFEYSLCSATVLL